MPNGLTPISWCRSTYLPVLYDVDTMCSPLHPFATGGVWAKHSGQLGWASDLLELEVRGFKQAIIPYMGQQDLGSVSSEGLIIDPDVHGLLDGPCDVVLLPTMDKLSTLV